MVTYLMIATIGSASFPLITMDLLITRTFSAPLEKVWQAWIDPAQIKKWWGPKDFTCPFAEIDFRVGGKYLYCMRGAMAPGMPEQDFWSTGVYREIVPMKRIICTDHFADEKGHIVSAASIGMPGEWPDVMVVTFTFEDAGEGKTKLTLKHEGHPDEIANDANHGWNQSLDKLEAALA